MRADGRIRQTYGQGRQRWRRGAAARTDRKNDRRFGLRTSSSYLSSYSASTTFLLPASHSVSCLRLPAFSWTVLRLPSVLCHPAVELSLQAGSHAWLGGCLYPSAGACLTLSLPSWMAGSTFYGSRASSCRYKPSPVAGSFRLIFARGEARSMRACACHGANRQGLTALQAPLFRLSHHQSYRRHKHMFPLTHLTV